MGEAGITSHACKAAALRSLVRQVSQPASFPSTWPPFQERRTVLRLRRIWRTGLWYCPPTLRLTIPPSSMPACRNPPDGSSVCLMRLVLPDRRREEDNGDLPEPRVALQPGRESAAVHLRHHNIEQDQVRMKLPHRLESFGRVVLRPYGVFAGAAQVQVQQASETRFV